MHSAMVASRRDVKELRRTYIWATRFWIFLSVSEIWGSSWGAGSSCVWDGSSWGTGSSRVWDGSSVCWDGCGAGV